MNEKMMRAVVIKEPTQADDVKLTECGIPEVMPGRVLVKVRAFGMNHSEKILRLNEINADHVFAADTELSWSEMAAVPETYFTAWGSLMECLRLEQSDVLLIRGATCALGYAAIQIAKTSGCKVIATTHKESKLSLLSGADEAVLDTSSLSGKLSGVTKSLELVGAKTLYDTLRCVETGGIVCSTGILGGIYAVQNFDPIKYIPNGVYLTGFYSNYPTQKTIDSIFDFIGKHNLSPHIGAEFAFENISGACKALDSGTVNGKIVVSV